jgi:hypothetical protein
MIRKNLLVVAVLTLLVGAASAQNAPTLSAEIRLLSFNPEGSVDEAFIQDPGAAATAQAVKAPVKSFLNHEFSTVLLTSRKFAVTAKPTRTSLTTPGELLAEVTLPEGVNSAIVIFLPAKKGDKAKFQGLVINDAKRVFPAGSYHATNLSPMPIRLVLEKKNFDFKPGQALLIEDPPVREGRKSGMRTFAFKDNVWMAMATGIWPHPGEARSVLLFFYDAATGDVQLRSFDDVAPRDPAKDKEVKPI